MRTTRFMRPVMGLAAFVALLALAGSASAGGRQPLDMYTTVVDAKTAAKIAARYDVAERVGAVAGGVRLDLVLTKSEANRLTGEGVKLGLIRNGKGQTVRQQAAAQALAGFQV